MQPTSVRERINPEQLKNKKREQQKIINENSDINNDDDEQRTRSIEEVLFFLTLFFLIKPFVFKLREMLKLLIRNRYKDIEDEFKKLDRGSYGELTPDLLYDLFKRFVYLFLF